MNAFAKRIAAKPEFGPCVLLVAMVLVFYQLNPAFLSVRNIGNTLAFTVELGLIALAMTLLMTAGEFDLSVGSLFGFCPVLMWTLYNTGTTSMELGFAIALLTATVIGLISGLFVTSGFPQRTWNARDLWLAELLVGDFKVGGLRLHMSLLWFLLAAVLLGLLLTRTRTGNWIQAAGGNPSAARARGVKIDGTKLKLFALSGAMAGFAGIVSSIRTAAANPNSGTGYELEVIAMVVIGGTALGGGRGTIIGTVLGIFILRLMRNGIVLVGVPGLAYNIFVGAIIVGMMALHSWLDRRHQEGR